MERGVKKSKGFIVLDYVRQFNTATSKSIAEMLARDYPIEFKDAETARGLVRFYRGTSGNEHRKDLKAEDYTPRFIAPETDEVMLEPYIVPDDAYPIVLLGDAHFPYHSQDALEIIIDRAIEIQAKTLIFCGDMLDCYQVSRWQKDPRKRPIASEISGFIEMIESIQNALPKTKIIYKFGNHEARVDHYIMNNAPALYGLEGINLQSLLGLKERGIEYIAPMQIIKIKSLNLIHGHEYVFSISNPVNAARGLYLRAKKTAITFHHHRTSEHTETTINNDTVTCWSVGCCCTLRPEYMPLNSWNHGFAEITLNDDMFHVKNNRIINYRIV